MGGGDRDVPEPRKLLGRHAEEAKGSNGSGVAGGVSALEVPICEREQTVRFDLLDEAQIGDAVRIVLGEPPAVLTRRGVVGEVTGRQEAATLVACIQAGYVIRGRIVAIDVDAGVGSATVAGTRKP